MTLPLRPSSSAPPHVSPSVLPYLDRSPASRCLSRVATPLGGSLRPRIRPPTPSPSALSDSSSVGAELPEDAVPVRYQLVVDCADPDLLARFWADALGYAPAPVPDGFATWNDFYRDLGVSEEDLVDGVDRISDP